MFGDDPERDESELSAAGRVIMLHCVAELREADMEAKAGDRLLVESEKVGQATRTGIIEEVLAKDPPRYRVQWEDGRITLYTPQAGAARIEAVRH